MLQGGVCSWGVGGCLLVWGSLLPGRGGVCSGGVVSAPGGGVVDPNMH